MCNIQGITTTIKKIDCEVNRGKITFYLSDNRIIIIPLAFFPEIQALKPSQRRKWQVGAGQYFTFADTPEIWGLQDILKLQY